MAGNRHHHLPRFLLKGFAIDHSSENPMVWMVRKGNVPVQVNTVNVGVSTKFYESSEDEEIDDKITRKEGIFAPALDSLRIATQNCDVNDPLVPDLVCHLSIRTKHFRDSLASTTDFLLKGMLDFMSDPLNLQSLMRTYISKHPEFIEEKVDEAFKGQHLPAKRRKWFIRQYKKMASSRLNSDMEEAVALFAGFRKMLETALRDVAAKSQLGALAKDVVPGPRAAAYREFTWHLIVTEDDLILGDCGPMHLEKSGRYRSIPDKPADVGAVFLPISTRHLLIGSDTGTQQLAVEELNKASASCSREFLIGCCEELADRYSSYLAQSGSFFRPEELKVMLEELIASLTD